MGELIGLFRATAGRLGLTERIATAIAWSWFVAPHWVKLMITTMGRREFRGAAGSLREIGEVAAELGDRVP